MDSSLEEAFVDSCNAYNSDPVEGSVYMGDDGQLHVEGGTDGLTLEKKDGTLETLKADTVITAFGMKPDLTTVDAIKAKYHTKTRVVGDSNKPGKIGDAVRDGFYAASSL